MSRTVLIIVTGRSATFSTADDLKPVSKQGLNWLYLGGTHPCGPDRSIPRCSVKSANVCAYECTHSGTIVDSLDTLLLMGLNAEYRRSIEWVRSL